MALMGADFSADSAATVGLDFRPVPAEEADGSGAGGGGAGGSSLRPDANAPIASDESRPLPVPLSWGRFIRAGQRALIALIRSYHTLRLVLIHVGTGSSGVR
jgi:hypothetical protein